MYGNFDEEGKFWTVDEIREIAATSYGVVTMEEGTPVVEWKEEKLRLVFDDCFEDVGFKIVKEEGKYCVSHSEFSD